MALTPPENYRGAVLLCVEGAGVHFQVHRAVAETVLAGHRRPERGGVPPLHPGAAPVRALLPLAGEQGVGGALPVPGEFASSLSSSAQRGRFYAAASGQPEPQPGPVASPCE